MKDKFNQVYEQMICESMKQSEIGRLNLVYTQLSKIKEAMKLLDKATAKIKKDDVFSDVKIDIDKFIRNTTADMDEIYYTIEKATE